MFFKFYVNHFLLQLNNKIFFFESFLIIFLSFFVTLKFWFLMLYSFVDFFYKVVLKVIEMCGFIFFITYVYIYIK